MQLFDILKARAGIPVDDQIAMLLAKKTASTTPPTPQYTYRFLTWIQSTGSGEEYVLTDIIPTYAMKIELDAGFGGPNYDITDPFDKYLFGIHGLNRGQIYVRWIDDPQMISYENANFCDGTRQWHPETVISDAYISGGFGKITIVLQRGTCYWGEQTCVCDYEITEPEPTIGIPIFGVYQSANAVFHGLKRREMRLYNMKFYNGESLIHNLAPAERQDGIIGLYDIAAGKFYPGTGQFVKGDYV